MILVAFEQCLYTYHLIVQTFPKQTFYPFQKFNHFSFNSMEIPILQNVKQKFGLLRVMKSLISGNVVPVHANDEL